MVDLASLQKYSLFGGVPPEEIERIKELLGSAAYRAGEVIQSEGEPSDRIHFIVEGRVEVTKRGAFLAELGEGDTFGEMEFLDVMPSAATVSALVPTRVVTISNPCFHQIYRMDVKTFAIMVMNLARDLSRHLRRMDEIIAGLQSPTNSADAVAEPLAAKSPQSQSDRDAPESEH